MASQNAGLLLHVGTFTRLPRGGGRAEGIQVCRFDPTSGALRLVESQRGVLCPAFLAPHPTRPFLYSVNEVWELDGNSTGGVSAFAVDPSSGALTFLNRQYSGGPLPCFLKVEASGRYLLVSSYAGGTVEILPIRDDGSLAPPSDHVQHLGSSVDPNRQTHAYAHSVNPDPANRFAIVCDLGLDKLMVYRMDLERGRLVPNDVPYALARPGSGPRHLEFHPNGRWVYVIHEIDATISLFDYEPERGTLREVEAVSTLPAGYDGLKSCADLHLHPSGRFLYGSNRGHDSIAVFAVDRSTGRLTPLGHESTRGEVPRGFVVDPTGGFLIVGNQRTDNAVTFRIDQATGLLSPVGKVPLPTPVCFRFWPS